MKPVLPGLAGHSGAIRAAPDKVIDLTRLLPSQLAADRSHAANSNALVLQFPTRRVAVKPDNPELMPVPSIWDRLRAVLDGLELKSQERAARRREAAFRRAKSKGTPAPIPMRPMPFGL